MRGAIVTSAGQYLVLNLKIAVITQLATRGSLCCWTERVRMKRKLASFPLKSSTSVDPSDWGLQTDQSVCTSAVKLLIRKCMAWPLKMNCFEIPQERDEVIKNAKCHQLRPSSVLHITLLFRYHHESDDPFSVGTTHLTMNTLQNIGPTENKQQFGASRLLWAGGWNACGRQTGWVGGVCHGTTARHWRVLVGGFGRSAALNPGTGNRWWWGINSISPLCSSSREPLRSFFTNSFFSRFWPWVLFPWPKKKFLSFVIWWTFGNVEEIMWWTH